VNANLLKIRLQAAVGVYLSDTHVTSHVIEKGLLRAHHHEPVREPTTRGDWAIALHKVLEPLAKPLGPGAAVIIGLPANHAFFATLPTGNKLEPAETLLSSHHCCTSIPPSDLSADMLPVKVAGRTFAAVGASRKKDLAVLTDVPRKLGFRFVRVEPGPWGLLRACSAAPAGKIALRLLVDENHMLAVLATGQQPLLWRSMELTEDSTDLMVSLVRTFETYTSQHLGVAGGLDLIALEGPKTTELAEKLRADLGPKFSVVAGPGPTPEAIARGLALGGMDRDKPAPDLARPLAPPPELWDLVPRGEVALLGAVVVCMGLWLWGSGSVAVNNALRAEEDNAKNPVLKVSDEKLKDEKKVLGAEVQAVSAFLNNRVPWTEYLNQLSDRVPPGIKFVSLQGEYEMTTGAEKAESKPK
jgi:hypothetical protein